MMFKQFDRRRRNGKIARLPVALRDSVDKMLLAGATYREIVQFLRENDVELSRQAVCNYARQFLCTTQQLRMAQENYKLLLDEMRRTPEMDTRFSMFHPETSLNRLHWQSQSPVHS